MARPATIKLKAMSVGNLLGLRAEVERHLSQHRKNLEELLSQISGYTKSYIGVDRSNPAKGTKVKPKYRGPKGETWAGRGMRPVWLAALIKQGHKLEKYAVGAKQAASSKRMPTKKSGKKAKRQGKARS
jgi:DNA-binding protein H-NS